MQNIGENGPTDFHIGPPARRDQNQFLRLQRHDPNHHTGLFCYRIVTGKGNAIAHCSANEPTRENKTLPARGPVRLSGGYSHRLGKLASGLKSSYKTGFVIGGDLAGFFNEYIGLGGFVNYRQYNDGSVSSVVAGPKILSRFYNRTQNSAFILGVGLGYVSYQESVSSIKATGSTFGTTVEAGYEIGLSKGVALMINACLTAGSLGKITVNGKTSDLDKRGSMSSLNLAVGLVFGR